VKLIQQKLLRLRPMRTPSQRDNENQSESDFFTEAEGNMDMDNE
jgi:hypothetical protein